MPRYQADEHCAYFCTMTVLDWVPVLIEARYIDPVIQSLRFCREHKGLELFAYVVMPNHVHLIAGCEDDLHAIFRDFKRFTSRAVHELLKEDGRVSILGWLQAATEPARRCRGELGFWNDGFHPQALACSRVFEQKLGYLHEKPSEKGFGNFTAGLVVQLSPELHGAGGNLPGGGRVGVLRFAGWESCGEEVREGILEPAYVCFNLEADPATFR